MKFVSQENTGATGTARNRKGMPPEVVKAKFKVKGDKIIMHKDNMMAMKVRDSKDVSIYKTQLD
jgi:hypothetical protein